MEAPKLSTGEILSLLHKNSYRGNCKGAPEKCPVERAFSMGTFGGTAISFQITSALSSSSSGNNLKLLICVAFRLEKKFINRLFYIFHIECGLGGAPSHIPHLSADPRG